MKIGVTLPKQPGLSVLANPNTVVHAYAELAAEGVVVCRHGSGTYVADTRGRRSHSSAVQALVPKADSLLTDAVHLSVGLDELLELIRERHERLKRPPPS